MGDEMIEVSSHSGMEVLETHYLDKRLVTKGKDIQIFGKSDYDKSKQVA